MTARPSSSAQRTNGGLTALSWIYQNRDLQVVLLFSLVGLVAMLGLMKYFPNLGAIVAQYNQF